VCVCLFVCVCLCVCVCMYVQRYIAIVIRQIGSKRLKRAQVGSQKDNKRAQAGSQMKPNSLGCIVAIDGEKCFQRSETFFPYARSDRVARTERAPNFTGGHFMLIDTCIPTAVVGSQRKSVGGRRASALDMAIFHCLNPSTHRLEVGGLRLGYAYYHFINHVLSTHRLEVGRFRA
jgi:hypothetical protein